MTSKISYFNALKEDMKRRIWPLALALIGFFFALPVLGLVQVGSCMNQLKNGYDTLVNLQMSFTKSMLGASNVAADFGLIFMAFINALQGMKYMHSKQETDFYDSLPMLRTTKFSAAFAGGLIITVIPFFASHLITALIGFSQGLVTVGGLWYGAQSALYMAMIYCLIYALVVLAVILTGHMAVAVAGAMVFLLGVLIYAVTIDSYSSTFFITRAGSALEYTSLSPLLFFGLLTSSESYDGMARTVEVVKDIPMKGIVMSLGSLAGAAMLFFAERALVNVRPAEAAGKAMAFKGTKSFIKVIIMIPASLLFGLFFYSVTETHAYAWLIFGIVIGLILSQAIMEIIYEFDFKACLKHPVSGGIGALIVAAAAVFFVLDPMGYDSKIPAKEQFVGGAIYAEDMETSIYYEYGEETSPLQRMNLSDIDALYGLARRGTEYAASIRMDQNNKIFPDGPGSNEVYEASDTVTYGNESESENEKHRTMVTISLKKRNGGKYTRRYTLDLSEADNLADFTRIFETAEYRNATYPILSEREVIDMFTLCYSLGNEYVEMKKISDEEKHALMDALEADTKELDMETVRTQPPIAQIDTTLNGVADDGMIDYSNSALRRYAYGGRVGMVYPSYERTIAELKKLGADIEGNYDVSNVTKITRSEYSEEEEEPKVDEYTSRKDIEELMPHLAPSDFTGTNYAVCALKEDNAYYEVEYKDGRNSLSCSKTE